jgi:hypothetical protein
MTEWIVAAVYAVGYVPAARWSARWLIGGLGAEDAMERIMLRALGCVIAIIWPLALASALVTGRMPKTDREIRDQLEERDKRITELERELGISQRV